MTGVHSQFARGRWYRKGRFLNLFVPLLGAVTLAIAIKRS